MPCNANFYLAGLCIIRPANGTGSIFASSNRFKFSSQRGKCSDIDRIAYFRDRVEQSIPADAGRIRQAAVGLGYAQNQMKLKRQIYIIYLKG